MKNFIFFLILAALVFVGFWAGYGYGQANTYKKLNDKQSINDIYKR